MKLKKILALMLALMLICSLAACSSKGKDNKKMIGENSDSCMCGENSRCMTDGMCKDGCMCMQEGMCTDKCMCIDGGCMKDGMCIDGCMCMNDGGKVTESMCTNGCM